MFHLIIILSSSRNWIPHANRNIWNKNRDGSRRNFSSVYLDTMRGHLTSLYLILGLSGKLFRLMSEGCSGGRGIFLNGNYGDESWDRRWYRAWEDTMQGAGSGLNMILTNWQSRPPNYGPIRVVNLAHLRCQIKIPQLSHISSDFTHWCLAEMSVEHLMRNWWKCKLCSEIISVRVSTLQSPVPHCLNVCWQNILNVSQECEDWNT